MSKLSVAVPCYNSAETLERCLLSLETASEGHSVEVIIINDGSRDATESIAERFVAKNPDLFRLINQQNGGHGAAVNTALANASGEYFRIVDSDDAVLKDGFSKLLDAMERLDADVFVDERVEYSQADNTFRKIDLPQFSRCETVIPFHEITGREYDLNFSMHTLTAKRRLLIDAGLCLFEHTFYVDMQYVIAVCLNAKTCCLVKAGVYVYTMGTQEQSCNFLQMAKNYNHHDRVLKGCLEQYKRSCAMIDPERDTFIRHQIALLTNTQYNIALIYNPDRRLGARQARKLREYLASSEPWLARATSKRYISALTLHMFGVSYTRLQRLKAAAGKA